MKQTHDYDDIIHLPRPRSARPPMPMQDRAAQFSPFAALTGYAAAIAETGRLTDARIELSDDEKSQLDAALRRLGACADTRPTASITYFRPDPRKTGGEYVTHSGTVRQVDADARLVRFVDGVEVSMEDIVEIETE
ncbi:MAG: hypothetical protein IJC15_04280 [Clostridia bacterium]|nr:hypothetical protein [Clostridia bacterium]